MAKSLSNAKPKVGKDKKPYLKEEVDLIDTSSWKKGKYQPYRVIGGIDSYVFHWIKFKTDAGKITQIPKVCANYNTETEELDDNGCIYCENKIRGAQNYLLCVIDRDKQESEPAKKAKLTASESVYHKIGKTKIRYKDVKSKSWTAIRVLNVPASVCEAIQNLSQLNQRTIDGETKQFEVSHPKYGKDIQVSFNPEAAGTAKWNVQAGDRTPLTEEELDMLTWDFSKLESIKPDDAKEMQRNWDYFESRLISDDNESPKKKSTKKRSKVDEDEVDVENDQEDQDEYYDTKKKSSKRKTKKRPVDLDLDEEVSSIRRKKKKSSRGS